MIDVTEIEGVEVGDRVTLLGTQEKDSITTVDLARWARTVPYEIPSHLGHRVRRNYFCSVEQAECAALSEFAASAGSARLSDPLESRKKHSSHGGPRSFFFPVAEDR